MIGGVSYILFAFVPMFIVASAVVVMGDSAMELAKNDYQRVLPTFVLTKMPLVMQILFFGALLSAIKSTSSATLLAPSTSFVENILKNLRPHMSDRQQLFAMRATIVCFTGLVLAYAIAMKGTSIYDLVSSAYQVTLVGAFVPLVMGLYWKRHHAGRDHLGRRGHRGVDPVLPAGGRRGPEQGLSRPARRPDRRLPGHGRRLAGAAEAAQPARTRAPRGGPAGTAVLTQRVPGMARAAAPLRAAKVELRGVTYN